MSNRNPFVKSLIFRYKGFMIARLRKPAFLAFVLTLGAASVMADETRPAGAAGATPRDQTIAVLETRIDALRAELAGLEAEVARLRGTAAAPVKPTPDSAAPPETSAATPKRDGFINPERLADATRFVEELKRRLFVMVDAMKRDLGTVI